VKFLDLFRPNWRHTDPAKRLTAVQLINDPLTLLNIVKNDTNPLVRIAAVRNLEAEHGALSEIACNDDDARVRAAAMMRLSDNHPVLTIIAKSDADANVRETATIRLSNPDVIADIANNDRHASVRIAAVMHLTPSVHHYSQKRC